MTLNHGVVNLDVETATGTWSWSYAGNYNAAILATARLIENQYEILSLDIS